MSRFALPWPLLVELLALAAAFAALCWFCLAYSAKTASGSDSYGYVSEAVRLSQGRFYEPERVFAPFGLPENSRLTFPLGYVPRGPAGTIPTYPFGYPLLMVAAIRVAGLDGAFWVAPLLAAGAVLLTYVLGRQHLGRAGGVLAAAGVFLLPNYSVSAFQAMSDVPATFFATLALVLLLARRPSLYSRLGLAAVEGVAIWIRPNLVLLVVPTIAWLLWRRERHLLLWFCFGLAPFLLVEGAVNQHLYGQPWRTGYGSIAWASLGDAAQRGGRYLQRLQDQQAGIGLVLVGVGVAVGRLPRSVRALLLGTGAILLLFFAFYPIDDAWWYGRFLLPALPAIALLEAAGLVQILSAFPSRRSSAVAAVLGLAFFGWVSWDYASSHGVFGVSEDERRYQDAARRVSAAVPEPALILTMQHSGSLRFYAGVPTARYDLGSPSDLRAMLQSVRSRGGPIYLLTDDWELAAIRRGDRAFLLAGARLVKFPGPPLPRNVQLFRLDGAAERAGFAPGAHPG